MKKLFFAGLIALILVGTAQAQQTIPYQSLLLLVAGPSGDRIDPREKAVVDHLNGIRSNYNFSQLQMGTMHYDRPQEASLLKNTLGFSPQKGITVGLVQLSDQGLPVRTLYKMEQVTQASLLAAQNDLLSRWSQTTGQPLPADLRPAGTAGGPTSAGGPPTPSTPPPRNPPVTTPPVKNPPPIAATNQPPRTTPPNAGAPEIYTFEGIQAVIFAVDNQVGGMSESLVDAPLRPDGNDVAVREQTKALAAATAALRAEAERGVIFPLTQLAEVARLGRAWSAAEPQYFLPVPMRSGVKPLQQLLRMVDEIQVQGQNTPTTTP